MMADLACKPRLREAEPADTAAILEVINQAAQIYRGVIPQDRWHEPYMTPEYLQGEVAAGVDFWLAEEPHGQVVGVMGVQQVRDVTLIRHAYVRPRRQRSGIGALLLEHLVGGTSRPTLVGTWAAAAWAIAFYEKHGFQMVTPAEKDRLLRRYWNIPERQIETSVVLADERARRRGVVSDTRWRRVAGWPDA